MDSPLRLMCILAHPDDESLALGGTLAKYAAEGIETYLVVATRGERGWFGDWREYPGEKALGQIREIEVRQAGSILGVTRLDFLDYIDGDVDQADGVEVIAKIVCLIRQIQPQVIVTFGPEGLYGHPDHIAISQFTTSAVICAADPGYEHARGLEAHRVEKLYYRVAPEEWFSRYMPIFGDLRMLIDGRERSAESWASWAITTRVECEPYWKRVWEAVLCHQTQLPYKSRLQRLTEGEQLQLWGMQEFYRVFSLVNGGRKGERDLFEGLWPVESEEHGAELEIVTLSTIK